MIRNSIFSFKDERENGDYDLYLFHDFSGNLASNDEDISSALNEVRKEIHSPDTIFIICIDDNNFGKVRHQSRFKNSQKLEYKKYSDIDNDIFKIGINQIVKDNKVVQNAPNGTQFKKTSGKESHYFIKASLSLSEHPQICFLALSLYQKIKEKILSIEKFYVDTSSIMPLIQALICYQNIVDEKCKFYPEIINFKSYNDNDIDFNAIDSYTIISASSSGGLQEKMRVIPDKCITIFLPTTVTKECLFQVNINGNPSSSQSLIPIPLITEDFSLEYSKSEEVIIVQSEIEKLDAKKLIKELLNDKFKKVKYNFLHEENYSFKLLEFEESPLKKILKIFTKDILNRCLLSEKDNYIICRKKSPINIGKSNIIKIDDFLIKKKSNIKDKNVIVFLNQSNEKELIQISRRLRGCSVFNITYIVGILLTENIAQSKILQNNICFNDTDYKYGFYCYLDLPLLNINEPDIEKGKLSDGFVFYKDKRSSKLKKDQVYLAVCLILELLRHDNKLSDNISFHHVISPKNFSRFNDSLLQLSILFAAKGRELNYCSNKDLSHEMLNVIIDLMKEDEDIGKIFIEHINNKRISLTQKDREEIELCHPELFNEEEEI